MQMQNVKTARKIPQTTRLLLIVSLSLLTIILISASAPSSGQAAIRPPGVGHNANSQCASSGSSSGPVSVQTGRYLSLIADSEVNGNPWTSVAELNLLDGDGNPLDRQDCSIQAVNSEETFLQDGRAINAIDGDPTTFWHTEWSRNEPSHPHILTIDLGASYKLCALRYLPRQGDTDFAQNGHIAHYRIHLSSDESTPGERVASGIFENTTSEQTAWFQGNEPSKNGVVYLYYEVENLVALPDFNQLTPLFIGTWNNFDIDVSVQEINFAIQFFSYIYVPSDGLYTFFLESDDGSKLYIDGAEVVDNDGLHGAHLEFGSVWMSAGVHSITVSYFQRLGNRGLRVGYQGPGIERQRIPDEVLYVDPVNVPIPTQTPTPTLTATNTSTATATLTPTSTNTPEPSATPTNSATPTHTATPRHTATQTPTQNLDGGSVRGSLWYDLNTDGQVDENEVVLPGLAMTTC